MLFLSIMIKVLTAGISFLAALIYTYRFARTPSRANGGFYLLVVLGKRLRDGKISRDYQLRLEKAWSLYLQSPNSKILIVGGKSKNSELTEAKAGQIYLIDKKVLENDILLGNKSRHTLENLQEAKKIIRAEGDESLAIVTNRYHLARCSIMANGLGLKHTLCPAEEKLILNAATAIGILIESFYVHWYIVGLIFSKVTKNSKMLSKIKQLS